LNDFPAPMSLCAITSLIGVVITAAVQLIQDHKIETSWPLVGFRQMVGYSLLVSTTFRETEFEEFFNNPVCKKFFSFCKFHLSQTCFVSKRKFASSKRKKEKKRGRA